MVGRKETSKKFRANSRRKAGNTSDNVSSAGLKVLGSVGHFYEKNAMYKIPQDPCPNKPGGWKGN